MLMLHLDKPKMTFLNHLRNTINGYDDLGNLIKQIKTLLKRLTTFLAKKLTSGIEISTFKDNINVKFQCPEDIRNEINLIFDKNTLIITRGITNKREIEVECYVPTERFSRWPYFTVQLPYEVDKELSTIEYKSGIIEITIPKKEQKQNNLKSA